MNPYADNFDAQAERAQRLELRRQWIFQRRGYWRGTLDPHVQQALAWLRAHEPDANAIPDATTIRVLPLQRPGIFGLVEVVRREHRILIDRDCDFYRQAEAGDVVPLAMLLAHERHHVLHGPSECGAYASSLRLLHKVRASPTLIQFVERCARQNDAMDD